MAQTDRWKRLVERFTGKTGKIVRRLAVSIPVSAVVLAGTVSAQGAGSDTLCGMPMASSILPWGVSIAQGIFFIIGMVVALAGVFNLIRGSSGKSLGVYMILGGLIFAVVFGVGLPQWINYAPTIAGETAQSIGIGCAT